MKDCPIIWQGNSFFLKIKIIYFFVWSVVFFNFFWYTVMAPHSSTFAFQKIPWMEEPGRLQSMGSLRVGHNWATLLSLFTFMHWRRKWQATPVFLPGESQGRQSLVGCRLWGCRVGHDWSDLAAAAVYCSTADQQGCDSFRWTVKGLSRTYTYILSPSNSPSIQAATWHWAEFPVLCRFPVGSCWLSILNRAVCTWPFQTPRLSLPSILPARGLPLISLLSRQSPVESLTLDSLVYSGLPNSSCVSHTNTAYARHGLGSKWQQEMKDQGLPSGGKRSGGAPAGKPSWVLESAKRRWLHGWK